MPKLKEKSQKILPTISCPLEYNRASFNELRKWMEQVEEEYPAAINIYLDADAGYNHVEFPLVIDRLETEEEAKARLEKNRKAREAAKRAAETRRKNKEERDRKLLEKLKKKYEED